MGDDLDSKVAGIPVKAILGIFAAIAVFYIIKKRSSAGATNPGVNTNALAAQTAQLVAAQTASAAAPNTNGTPSNSTYEGGQAMYNPSAFAYNPLSASSNGLGTNIQWLSAGTSLGSEGGYEPFAVQSALQDYLNGQSLTTSQAKIVDYVLSTIGLPPEPGTNGGFSTTTANAPAPAPAPNPAPSPTPSAAAPFNPYPVGTVVQPNGEKIVQTIPLSHGYVDVTSLGGLYTPGYGVNGSDIGMKPLTGNVPFSAQVQGNTVYEYSGQGVNQYNLAG